MIHIFNEVPKRPDVYKDDLSNLRTCCGKAVTLDYIAERAIGEREFFKKVTCVFCKDELARRIAALDLACPPTPAGQEFVYHQLALLKRYLSGS